MNVEELIVMLQTFPKDTIVDGIKFAEIKPSGYDGCSTYPNEDGTYSISECERVTLHSVSIEDFIWDNLDYDKTRDENYDKIMNLFKISVKSTYRETSIKMYMDKTFQDCWRYSTTEFKFDSLHELKSKRIYLMDTR